MISKRAVLLVVCCCASSFAQSDGIAPAWDVNTTLKEVQEQAERYVAVASRLTVEDWISKGAPNAYAQQRESIRNQAGYIRTVNAKLREQPEKLPLVMDVYFRLQAIEGYTSSLADAAGRYQAPEVEAELNQLLTLNSSATQKLRQYMVDLAAVKEQEIQVAISEAQRCQAVLNRNPLAPRSRSPLPTKSEQEKK